MDADPAGASAGSAPYLAASPSHTRDMPPLRASSLLLPLAALLIASCKKDAPEPAKPQTPSGPQKSSGASIMLRGNFEDAEGSSLSVLQKLTIEGADILQRIGENETTGTMTIAQTEQQTIHFLQGGGREIEIGEGGSTLTTQFAELDPIEETQPDRLAGKTLIASATPDRGWSYSVKGEPDTKVPAGFNAADLRSDELYPTEWKDIGENWSPEPSALGALLGPGFQLTEGKITMRLLNYVKRKGHPCGEIAADIEAKGLFRSGKARQDISLKLKGKIYRSLNIYQDLEAELNGNIEMYQRMGNADVRIEGPVKFERDAVWYAPGAERP